MHRLSLGLGGTCKQGCLSLEQVDVFGKDKEFVLRNVSMHIGERARIGLLGKNGSGKTTLATHIAEHADNPRRLRIRTLPQFGPLWGQATNVIEWFMQQTGIDKPHEARRFLGRCGLTGNALASIPPSALSGGEATKLRLAVVAHAEPDVLILDEVTNGLDMESRAELVRAIHEFDGSVVIVSHSFDFLEQTCNEFYECDEPGRKVRKWDRGIRAYKEYLIENIPTLDRL